MRPPRKDTDRRFEPGQMAKHMDAEDLEIKTALKHSSLEGKEILEVGCGDGRMSFRYAGRAKRVVAIDPSADSIETARRNLPKQLATKLTFRVGRGEELGDFQPESFDVVFFTWSLCCTDIPVMGRAIDEAWRVLRRDGVLVNLQPSLNQPFGSGALTYVVKKKFGTTVDDERYRQARFALKYKALIEGMFDLVGEEEFPVKTVYDTVGDAVEDLARDAGEQYKRLDEKTKQRIQDDLKSRGTASGIEVVENAVLSALRKRGSRVPASRRTPLG
jgi:ubiquinone/menaquinone biosynthesis C-methylase UbiE